MAFPAYGAGWLPCAPADRFARVERLPGAARFNHPATLQTLTWRDGDAWYQLVAMRPGAHGPPYTVADLLAIAADLR